MAGGMMNRGQLRNAVVSIRGIVTEIANKASGIAREGMLAPIAIEKTVATLGIKVRR
jgi:hypothetical protein